MANSYAIQQLKQLLMSPQEESIDTCFVNDPSLVNAINDRFCIQTTDGIYYATFLHIACIHKRVNNARVLLERRPDISLLDGHQRTPLFIAVAYDDEGATLVVDMVHWCFLKGGLK